METQSKIMPKKRIEYLDVAKGIAILLVIIGHTNVYFKELNTAIFSFHMPLFLIISGYFLSTKLSVKDYAKKKVRQLLPPYIFSGVLMIVLSIPATILLKRNVPNKIINHIYGFFYGAGIRFKEPFKISPIGAIWFLLALLFALLIVRYFINKENGCLIITLIALLGYYTAFQFWLPFSIQAGMTAAFYVMIGYCAKKYNLFIFLKNIKLLSIVFIITLIVFVIYSLYGGRLSMVRNYYQYGILTFIVSILNSVFAIIVSYLLSKINIIKRILTFYGKYSLIILCTHFLEVHCIPWALITKFLLAHDMSKWLVLIILSVLKIVISTVLTIIIIHIPLLSKIFSQNAISKKPALA